MGQKWLLKTKVHITNKTKSKLGGQTRGYLNIKDTLQCVELSLSNPASKGELKIYNQFTEQFTVNEIAERISCVANDMGLKTQIQQISNPRKELEDHYYNAKHHQLLELGLKPHYMTNEVLEKMLEKIIDYKSQIDISKILPRVAWK